MRGIRPSSRFPRLHRAASSAAVLASTLVFLGLVPADEGRPQRQAPTLARRQAAAPTAADTARALHLLQRATFGARPGDLAEVLRTGPEAWLERQLHPERIPDGALEERLAAFPAAAMEPGELFAAFPPPNPAQRAERARRDSMQMTMRPDAAAGNADDGRPGRERRRGEGQGRPRGPQAILFDLAGARLQRAVYSERQLQEVMTDFWFNHFNVFFGKNQDRYLTGDYERRAIRPHVFGRFRDLLEATASHPAMLVYLDNWTSAAPNAADPAAERIEQARRRWRAMTPAQRRAAVESGRVPAERVAMLEGDSLPAGRRRARGINENYARELMELHTLGVNGGYTQGDVIEVARAFTGWTIDARRVRGGTGGARRGGDEGMGPRWDGGFVFRPAMHDAGEKTVLGRRLPAGRGIEDGREVLDLLARHPATARHVATKLAQRFVADEPPPALVDRLAEVFLRTDGDLREVTRALFTSPEFDDPRYRGTKVKTPFEFVASALRATGADAGPSRGLLQALRQLGQVPYAATAPTGYPHTSEEWTNSGAMLNRMNLGLALAAGRLDGVRLDESGFVPSGDVRATVETLAARVLPGRRDEQLVRTIVDDLGGHAELGPRQRAARALGLLIGSPAFQRR
ncbi:MAG TPA: DUF1800 domain-containing protein [Longimicrobium sp.]|jgi:uncharacterized protein (DUF1800 family)